MARASTKSKSEMKRETKQGAFHEQSAALKKKMDAAKNVAGEEGPDRAHKYLPTFKAPKTAAQGADAFFKKREERLQMQKKVEALEAEEADLKAWLIAELPKSSASSVGGKVCRVTLVRKPVPRVTNWPLYYAGIVARYQAHKRRKDGLEDGAFALLQRRVGEAAIKEAWENGEGVEGVEKFEVTTLSVSKL